jgi:hypothetical protein
MKVKIGSYPSRLISRVYTHYMTKKYGYVAWPKVETRFEKFLEKVEDFLQTCYSPINYFLDKRAQKVSVKIDPEDFDWEAGAKKQSETKLDPEWISKHQLICDHCNKSVDTANYERWHGDNCSVVKPRISTPIKNYITCPHCFKEGKDGSAMRRWHFNNCKKVK